MALVFTLGIFSIYSFFIVAGAISWRAAWLLGGLIVALGWPAGLTPRTAGINGSRSARSAS